MIDLQTLITAIKENKLDVFQNISQEDIQPHLDAVVDAEIKSLYLNHTLLSLAAYFGRTEIAKALIQLGADVNKANNHGSTPLHRAALNKKTEIVALLLKHNADVNKADKDGETPLYGAAFRNNTQIVDQLLQHNADVNKADKDGETPLYWAAFSGNAKIVELLLKHNADVNKADNDGETPLYLAADSGYTETVQVLVKAHISQNKIDTLLTLSRKYPIISRAMEKYQDRFKIAKLYHRMKDLRHAPELAQTEADHKLIRIGKLPHTMQIEILSRTVGSNTSDNFHELLFKHTNKNKSQTDGDDTTQTVSTGNKRKRDGDDDPNPTPEKRTKQETSKPMI